MMETVFSVGSAPRLYNKDPRPAEGIIERLSLDGSGMIEKRWQRKSAVQL
jgi:hypothetical protein